MNLTSNNKLIYTDENGNKFYTNNWTESTDEYAKSKNVKNVKCVIAEQPNGYTTYLLLQSDGKQMIPIYENQSFEAIGVHVDMIHIANKID